MSRRIKVAKKSIQNLTLVRATPEMITIWSHLKLKKFAFLKTSSWTLKLRLLALVKAKV